MVKNLYVSGYRSYELAVFSEDDPKIEMIQLALKERLLEELDNGLEWVLIGGQMGVETWVGAVVSDLKEDYPHLQLGVILPYADFDSKWNEKNQLAHARLLAQADYVNHSSTQPYKNPGQLQANQAFLIQQSDKMLLVYDLDYEGKPKYHYDLALSYQERQADYEIELITMFDLQDTAEQEQLRRSLEEDW